MFPLLNISQENKQGDDMELTNLLIAFVSTRGIFYNLLRYSVPKIL